MLLEEVNGDLFTIDKSYVLAHCVSNDARMGAGIAKQFVQKYELFPNIKMHVYENSTLGRVVRYSPPKDVDSWIVYNLVTKEKYFHKPTYACIESTLLDLRDNMLTYNEQYLAMPRIASGLDKKDFNKVKEIIFTVFEDTEIKIKIFSL